MTINQKKIPNGWRERKLGDIGETIIGLTYSPNDVVQADGTLVLRSSNIRENRIDFDDQVRVEVKIPDRLITHEGDLLICARNGSRRLIGKNAYIEKNAAGNTFGAFMSIFRTKQSNFVHFLFQSQLYKKAIERDLGPTINQVTTGNLNSFKFYFPPQVEQKKIVKLVKTWDTYLEKLGKKIETKKKIKKGLMQQLLTGKKRMSGFSGKWEKIKLGNVCRIYKGKELSKEKLVNNGRYKCILYGQIYTLYDVVVEEVVSKTDTNEGLTSLKYDVLIPSSTTTSALDIATATTVVEDGILLGGDINIIRQKRENSINGVFLSHYLTFVKKLSLAKLAQGITIVHLYGKDLKNIKINLPSIEEQNHIADVLLTARKEIESLEQKREIIAQQKKYLLNNLITGEIRLPEFRD